MCKSAVIQTVQIYEGIMVKMAHQSVNIIIPVNIHDSINMLKMELLRERRSLRKMMKNGPLNTAACL